MISTPSIGTSIGRRCLPSAMRSAMPSVLPSPSIGLPSAFFHPLTILGAIEAPSRAHSPRVRSALRWRFAGDQTLTSAGRHLARELLQRSHCGYFLRAHAHTRARDSGSSSSHSTSVDIPSPASVLVDTEAATDTKTAQHPAASCWHRTQFVVRANPRQRFVSVRLAKRQSWAKCLADVIGSPLEIEGGGRENGAGSDNRRPTSPHGANFKSSVSPSLTPCRCRS